MQQQLDIFNDSRDRVLVNHLADALVAGDIALARQAARALRDEFAHDRHLSPAALLIDALAHEAGQRGQPWPDANTAQAACDELARAVHDAAHTVLGAQTAAPWLAQRWHALATRSRALPFDAAQAQTHAAALWLRAGDWAAAEAAVQAIESWRHKPQALAWMAQATWRQHGPDAGWPLLTELAWLSPSRLEAVVQNLPDTALHKLMKSFEWAPDWAWWPAWLLVQQPLLAAPLQAAQTAGVEPPERAFKLMQTLLRLERRGEHHELVAQRRTLKTLHAGLFAAYMATR